MSDTSVPRASGDAAGRVAEDATGRVLTVATGFVRVRVRRRTVRASYGGALLASIAQDADHAPRVGDRVQVRTWADGRSTVERIVARAVP